MNKTSKKSYVQFVRSGLTRFLRCVPPHKGTPLFHVLLHS